MRSKVIPTMMILLFGSFSLGAWWDFGQSKQKTTKTEESQKSPWWSKQENKQTKQAVTEQPVIRAETLAPPVIEKKSPATEKINQKELAEQTMTGSASKGGSGVEQIRQELSQIVQRTKTLQNQVQGNRTQIHKIMERAQMHEKILRRMKVAQPVSIREQTNVEEILKAEKIRLIAEQSQRSRNQLRIIEQAKAYRPTPTTPAKAKTN
jgi:hypothetical protein